MAHREQESCSARPVFYLLNMDAQDAQDNQDGTLLHDLQSFKYKALIIIDLLWTSPLQIPHFIPLFKRNPLDYSGR